MLMQLKKQMNTEKGKIRVQEKEGEGTKGHYYRKIFDLAEKANQSPNGIALIAATTRKEEEEVISLFLFKDKRKKRVVIREFIKAKYYVPRTGKNLKRKKRSKNDPQIPANIKKAMKEDLKARRIQTRLDESDKWLIRRSIPPELLRQGTPVDGV